MKKKIILVVIITLFTFFIYNLYKMYQKIEIKENYEAKRTELSTKYEQTVENVTKESKTVANMLEEITRKCCRNFKINKCRRVNIK